MQIYNATVTFTPGNFMDTQWGRKTSLGFDVPGFDKTQRIWIKEDQKQKLADHMQLQKDQTIQVARVEKGDKSYWEVVNLPKAELPPVDDGLPFAPPAPSAPTTPPQNETPEEKQARLEAKANELKAATANGAMVLANCYTQVIMHLQKRFQKTVGEQDSEEMAEYVQDLLAKYAPTAAEIQSMAVSLFIHLDRKVKF
jgi:hypothetical protein